MNQLTKDELDILEEVLNEEILSYLDSGYKKDCEWVVILRNLLSKLNSREYYNFDEYYYHALGNVSVCFFTRDEFNKTLKLFYDLPFSLFINGISDVLLIIAAVLSIISGAKYYMMAREYITDK